MRGGGMLMLEVTVKAFSVPITPARACMTPGNTCGLRCFCPSVTVTLGVSFVLG